MITRQALDALSALAQTTRLAAFRQLVVAGPEGLTPTELTERLGVSAPTLSFHLRGLQQAGLISAEQQGRHILYRADFAAMQGLVDYLTENCCGGHMERCQGAPA